MKDPIRKIHLFPYYHHDHAWCNTRRWHIWRYVRAFEETVELMQQDPDLTLTVDNIDHSMRDFIRYCPEKLEPFRALVKSGRICVSNGGMALIRPGLFDGELYIRNAVDGLREFCSLFGLTPEDIPTFWNADTAPGCTQIPQIMQQMGCRLYRFKRPGAAMDSIGVPEVFHWKGLDGSTVIAERTSYSAIWEETFRELTEDNWPEMRARFFREHLEARRTRINTDEIIVPFGCDDSLPLRSYFDQPINIKALMTQWNANEPSEMVWSTPNRYLAAIEQKDLPTWEGVLDPNELSFNPPFRADRSLWRARFEAERTLLLGERLHALLTAMGGKASVTPDFPALWQRTYAFSGHAMQYLLGEDYTPVLESARATVTLAREHCRTLADEIASLAGAGSARRHVLINPSSCPFDGLAELHITSEQQVAGLRLHDSAGQELPWQLTKIYEYMPDMPNGRPGQYSEVRVVCPVSVPANGYEIVFVSYDGDRMPDIVPADAEDTVIDAGRLLCRVEHGMITELIRDGKTLLHGAPLCQLRFVATAPTTSWFTDYEGIGEAVFRPTSSVLRLNGPLRWELETRGTVADSPAQLVTVIERDSPEISFFLTLDDREKEGYFLADLPCDVEPMLFAGVPFGEEPRNSADTYYAKRDTAEPMTYLDFERNWEGQLWANGYLRGKLSGTDAALLQGDCDVYYQNVPHSGRLSLLLMKSIDLDARTDRWVRDMSADTSGRGLQHFRFGFCLADADPTLAFRAAVERFRLPIMDTERYFRGSGTAPERFSAFDLSAPNVCVSSVRYTGGEYIVRLYEAVGKACRCTLHSAAALHIAVFTDLLDRPTEKDVTVSGDKAAFAMKPWEIATLHLAVKDRP